MTKTKDLEARIANALSRIRAVTDQPPPVAEGADPVALKRLERVNVALRAQLKDMERKREADIAQLDGLIAELRPLVEEAEHG